MSAENMTQSEYVQHHLEHLSLNLSTGAYAKNGFLDSEPRYSVGIVNHWVDHCVSYAFSGS